MLKVPSVTKESQDNRNHRRETNLWHDGGKHMPSLGCTMCHDRQTCGGLRIERAFYDCLDNCCGQFESCDAVCRMKPLEFTQRVREIGGFGLDNIPRAKRLPEPTLPNVVPVLFHGNRREARFAAPAICLQLYRVIARHKGEQRFGNADAIAKAFRFETGTPLILTGTADDRPLERWWSLGRDRLDTIRRLRDLGVELVTAPNFSLFTDRPRWDDMHSMKRIAIVHEEFLRAGLPAALHVNARTERDWERWTEYIHRRTEISHVAFEFATGAGRTERTEWHATRLAELAQAVDRSLHLIVRAANGNILPKLVSTFAKTTVLDTTSFLKAVHRQSAIEKDTGMIHWKPSPTVKDAPIDDLLTHNWTVVSRSYDPVFGKAALPQVAG